MQDLLMMAAFLSGFLLALISGLSFVLHYVVALRSPPQRRALWTAGLAYCLAVIVAVFWGPPESGLWAPLAAAPGAGLAYFYWRWTFRTAWVDSPEMLAEGDRLENDDWRIGLAMLGIAIAIAAVRALATT